jgi:flagellum-specific peptidoglycan hydrolase FlgJ
MNAEQAKWVKDTSAAAESGSHCYPLMAACEAALESDYGQSELARDANNLFGMKQHAHPEYGTLSLPTKEFLDGSWKVVEANWVKYPLLAECFLDRMHTLGRLAPYYAHYKAALEAPDERTYVQEVSRSWSTNPERANKVTEIYDAYAEYWAANPGGAAINVAPAPVAPTDAPAPMGVDESTQV